MANEKEIERRLEEIFGKGSREEIEGATTSKRMAERNEEMSKNRTITCYVGEDTTGDRNEAE